METKSLKQLTESFLFFFLTKLIQIKGLIWLYNISLWYTIVVCENVCGVKNVIILFLMKTIYLDLWLQALQ